MGPAELPQGRRMVFVGAPSVTAKHPRVARAQQTMQSPPGAPPPGMEERARRRDRRPDPGAPAAATPAGLIHIHHGCGPHRLSDLCPGGLQCTGTLLQERLHAAQRGWHLQHLLQECAGLPTREVEAACQQGDEGAQAGAEVACADLHRKGCTRGAAAGGAAERVEAVLGDVRLHRRQLGHLVPHRGALLRHVPQGAAAVAALGWTAGDDRVEALLGNEAAMMPSVPRLPTGLAAAGLRLRTRGAGRVRGGWTRRVAGVHPEASAQLGDFALQLRDALLLPQQHRTHKWGESLTRRLQLFDDAHAPHAQHFLRRATSPLNAYEWTIESLRLSAPTPSRKPSRSKATRRKPCGASYRCSAPRRGGPKR
jgi:hypothetical protein